MTKKRKQRRNPIDDVDDSSDEYELANATNEDDESLADAAAARIDAAALADDPVRMYLKEIGQVPLLDTNREIWLSIQIASGYLLQTLTDQLSKVDDEGDIA